MESSSGGGAAPLGVRGGGRGWGGARAPVGERGHPRVALVAPLVDPVEDPTIEEKYKAPVAEQTPVELMITLDFHEDMSHMLRFVDTMTQVGLIPAYPTAFQVGLLPTQG